MVRSVCPDNIELKENINLPGVTIVGNETQLNQVILNIGVNAIHAIGHETGEIEVSAILIKRIWIRIFLLEMKMPGISMCALIYGTMAAV